MGVLQGPEFYISKRVGRAIMDYKMLAGEDKIAVGVSGGKDSLTLLRILHDRRKFVPIKYQLLALHIDLGYPYSCAKILEKYFKKIGVRYHIKKVNLLKKTKPEDISCFWCSWNRRKALFETANRLGFSKIALGHHKDDVVQTTLLNLFFQGENSFYFENEDQFLFLILSPLKFQNNHYKVLKYFYYLFQQELNSSPL